MRKLMVLLTVIFCSFSVWANDYMKLTQTQGARAYWMAVERGHIYPLNEQAKGPLEKYYTGMTFKNNWEKKSRVLDDDLFYDSVGNFSGEVCALIWRHRNGAPQVAKAGNVGDSNFGARKEQTPFYSTSQFYTKELQETYEGFGNNAYSMFTHEGNKYKEERIGFPLHRLGLVSGQYGQGREENVVLSMQTFFLKVDNNGEKSNMLSHDTPLITLILLPGSYGQIAAESTERDAYELCKAESLFIVPHRP